MHIRQLHKPKRLHYKHIHARTRRLQIRISNSQRYPVRSSLKIRFAEAGDRSYRNPIFILPLIIIGLQPSLHACAESDAFAKIEVRIWGRRRENDARWWEVQLDEAVMVWIASLLLLPVYLSNDQRV